MNGRLSKIRSVHTYGVRWIHVFASQCSRSFTTKHLTVLYIHILVSFQNYNDREEVLRRSKLIRGLDGGAGRGVKAMGCQSEPHLYITEDTSRRQSSYLSMKINRKINSIITKPCKVFRRDCRVHYQSSLGVKSSWLYYLWVFVGFSFLWSGSAKITVLNSTNQIRVPNRYTVWVRDLRPEPNQSISNLDKLLSWSCVKLLKLLKFI